MESNLRPLTLGEILDRTAQLYRTNFLLFAGIFSVYAGVALVLNLLQIGLGVLLKAQHMAGAAIWMTAITTGVNLLVLFLLLGAATAAISRAVAWVHLGEPATIRGAYLSILPRLGRYLWLMTITAFRVWTPFVLLYAGLIGALVYYGGFKGAGTQTGAVNPQTAGVLAVVFVTFILLLIPVAVYTTLMSLRYSLAIPACVVENLKARNAIRRSIRISQKLVGTHLPAGIAGRRHQAGPGRLDPVLCLYFGFQAPRPAAGTGRSGAFAGDRLLHQHLPWADLGRRHYALLLRSARAQGGLRHRVDDAGRGTDRACYTSSAARHRNCQ